MPRAAHRSRAMVLESTGGPLHLREREIPRPAPGQVLLRVHACAVCRTDLHVLDGELPDVPHPIVPGHEIIGMVQAAGAGVRVAPGTRLGVPWLGWTCGRCWYCTNGKENLCDAARFTGYQIDGGYAEHVLADARYCFAIPDAYGDVGAAPLLCAGLIGYRALRAAGDARRVGLYGFGAAAHIVAQVARFQGRKVYAFTRPGDVEGQDFARRLGADWVGGSDEMPPVTLDAVLIFAPIGALVPAALGVVRKGGTVVCAGIHMSDIPTFPYARLWGRAASRLGRQPHATRRRGVARARAGGTNPHRDRALRPRGSERCPREPALGCSARCGCAGHGRCGCGAPRGEVAPLSDGYGVRSSSSSSRLRS
jgi:propanol-preferring alcohol dehydrogenase